FHRILGRLDRTDAGSRRVAVDAVFEDADSAIALPGQMISAEIASVPIAAHGEAWDQIQGGIDVPLVERELVQRVAPDQSAGGRRFRLEQRGSAGHFNRFSYVPDLHDHVDGEDIAGAQIYPFAHDLLE